MAMRVLAALAALLLGVNVARAQERWLELRSEHYTFIGNVDDDDLLDVATRFEAFYSGVSELFSSRQYPQVGPLTAIVVDDDDRLEELGLEGSDGYFLPDDREDYVATRTESNRRRPFDIVFHDYFHKIADRSIPNAPLWLVEGLAQFYQTVVWSADGGQLQIGRPIDSLVRLVRDEEARLTFDELFALNPDSGSYDEVRREDIFHAQTWAFVHFLMTRNEGQSYAETIRFVRLMASGDTFEEAVDNAFGLNFRTLLGDFENNVTQRGTYPYLTLAVGNSSRGVGPAEPVGISPAETETQLAELLIHQGALLEAEQRLQQAIEMDSGAIAPRVVMGRLLIDQARFEEARVGLEPFVGRSNTDSLSHYYYALSLLGPGLTGSELVEEARRELREAIRLDPRFADSYHELALSYLNANENLDEAAELLDTALELRPRDPDFRISLGQVFIEQERFNDVRTLLTPMVDGIELPDTQSRARSIMQSIEGLEGSRGVIGDGFTEITRADPEPGELEGVNPEGSREPSAASVGFDRFELTRIVSGQQQEGLLSLIDCREGLTLTLEADSGTYLFHTDSPERVEFATFTSDVGAEVGCGPLDPPVSVIITFNEAPEGSEFAGSPDKVEFVKGQ